MAHARKSIGGHHPIQLASEQVEWHEVPRTVNQHPPPVIPRRVSNLARRHTEPCLLRFDELQECLESPQRPDL